MCTGKQEIMQSQIPFLKSTTNKCLKMWPVATRFFYFLYPEQSYLPKHYPKSLSQQKSESDQSDQELGSDNWIRAWISAATLPDFSPQGVEEWEEEGEEEKLQRCGRQSAWGPGPVAEGEAWMSKPNELLQWKKTRNHRCGDLHINRPHNCT